MHIYKKWTLHLSFLWLRLMSSCVRNWHNYHYYKTTPGNNHWPKVICPLMWLPVDYFTVSTVFIQNCFVTVTCCVFSPLKKILAMAGLGVNFFCIHSENHKCSLASLKGHAGAYHSLLNRNIWTYVHHILKYLLDQNTGAKRFYWLFCNSLITNESVSFSLRHFSFSTQLTLV